MPKGPADPVTEIILLDFAGLQLQNSDFFGGLKQAFVIDKVNAAAADTATHILCVLGTKLLAATLNLNCS